MWTKIKTKSEVNYENQTELFKVMMRLRLSSLLAKNAKIFVRWKISMLVQYIEAFFAIWMLRLG